MLNNPFAQNPTNPENEIPKSPADSSFKEAKTFAPVIPNAHARVSEYVRVYVLGKLSGATVIEEFEGATGYHIRTIPASKRYSNPVLIGAGGGYLAVIDRFGNTDLIRVSDPRANAPLAAFDADGFPLDTFPWGSVQDNFQVNISQYNQGSSENFVKGVTITPRGVLIATLNHGFVVWDAVSQSPPLCHVYDLPAPFDEFTLTGTPGYYEQKTSEGVYLFTTPAISPEGEGCLLLINYVQNHVEFAIPGGNKSILGGIITGEIASLHMSTDGVSCDQVVRHQFADRSYFGCGNTDTVFSPGPLIDTAISATRTAFDVANVGGYPEPPLLDAINRSLTEVMYTPVEESTIDGGDGRALPAGSTAGSMNLDREQLDNTITTLLAFKSGTVINAKTISTPTSAGIKRVTMLHNMVAELNTLDLSDDAEAFKPLYRILHGSNYDFYSDGGFVYGCLANGDVVQPVNDFIETVDIAIDRSAEKGTLKNLPDAKFVLVDFKTGLFLPQAALKSLGYNLYAGNYAILKTLVSHSDGYSRAATTNCANLFYADMEAHDGIHRVAPDANPRVASPSLVKPITLSPTATPAYASKLTDLSTPTDFPWSCFEPRIIPPATLLTSPHESNWTRHDDDGAFLPNWLSPTMRVDPTTLVSQASVMMYPKVTSNTNDTIFATSCSGGFFYLNWEKTRVDEGETTRFVIPDSILNNWLGPMEPTPAQEDATVPEDINPPSILPLPYFVNTVQNGDYPNLTRTVGFDTNIRSWIGVEIKLDRTGILTDGKAAWTQPAAYDNGLGVAAAKDNYVMDTATRLCPGNTGGNLNPNGAEAGNGYDHGDYASGGATGAWEIDVFFNGVPAKSIATKVTYLEQIDYQAPTDLIAALNNTFNASGGVDAQLGFHKGRVYFTPEVVKTVTVKARLVNYAYDVYRVGYHTISFRHADYFGGVSLCPGADPGFFAGNNCEAICCGNVSCLSQVMYGNKLYSGDTVRPLVVNVLWEGECTYTIPDSKNPYLTNNCGVGNFLDVYFDFNLNGTMSAWDINLRLGSQGRTPQTSGF